MKLWLVSLIPLLAIISPAHSQAPFYQGKTIRIVTGYPAGDVNDLWPRLIAQHMGKYIPGNPIFIVQNMPGASSMIAANYVYGVAKPDGVTLAGSLRHSISISSSAAKKSSTTGASTLL